MSNATPVPVPFFNCVFSRMLIFLTLCLPSDDDDDVTCYCKKPYAGRPMIECSSCSVWVHLACAKVKRTAIPDMWYCQLCKTKSTKGGAKARARARARKSTSSKALLGLGLATPSIVKKKS